MSALCSRAARVSLASSRRAAQPLLARCWLTRSRTCCSKSSAPDCGVAPGTPDSAGFMLPADGEPVALALGLVDGDGLVLGEALGLMLLRPSSPVRVVPVEPSERPPARLAT